MSTTKDLRAVMKSEYAKCVADPVYFMKKYVKIQHPVRGTIPFDTYEFQDETLSWLAKQRFNIILKSRQMGISTLVAAYTLWLMIFFEDKNILCISTTQKASKEIVTKIRFGYDNLPSWLKVPAKEDNQLSLRLTNGSFVQAASSAGSSARGNALSLLIIDEAAFIDNVEDIWLGAQNTLSTGGSAIVLSTPNGVGNFFHQKWVEAEAGKNEFNKISLPWHLHPERDQSWRDLQTKNLGPKGAAQECDCEFSTSGNTVVEIATLEEYERVHVKDPIEKRGIDKGYWIWEYPKPGSSYLVTCDVARGDGSDYSTVEVFDLETMEQCAEYQGQLPTKEFANVAMTIATEYNTGLLVIENANVGWSVIQVCLDREYPNLFYSSADLQYVDVEAQMSNKINTEERKMTPGFTTSSKTRPLVISKLEAYIRNKEVIIHSQRLIGELKVFIWKPTSTTTKAEAMDGYNDDLVMAFGIGMWIRDTALRLRKEVDSVTRMLISRFGSSSNPAIKNNMTPLHGHRPHNPYGISEDPWKMKMGGQVSEDLRWLIQG